MGERTIAITATFTAEPVEESLAFWIQELSLPFTIRFAPYNQVFQQLLDSSSLLSNNGNGINVVLLRLEDWLKGEDDDQPDTSSGVYEKVERNVRDLMRALKRATERSPTPYVVCLCRASRTAATDHDLMKFFRQIEELMMSELDGVSSAELVATADLEGTYPVANYDDPHGDKLGKVPYTQAFFASLGTILARKIHALLSSRHKVIVLDCDQTLWKGVCGEVGAQGIEIDPYHRYLQEFFVRQQAGGMLLCLCSKNNEDDVVSVLECRSEMPLKRDHLVSWRINWRPKSENLKSLAEELHLGLDSFVFIDDDPVACAEVQANCPEILVLQLPHELSHLPQFLDHVWAFDHSKATGEDQRRTLLYRQNHEREHFRTESLSFTDFLSSLELKVRISEICPEHLARVSQLTQRTNQFNSTTIRRSEREIQGFCQSDQSECLVVEVSDRFGHYGLVGVMMFQTETETLNVDTFLLSCRALGRGIEHRMLARLGEIAREHGLGRVDTTFMFSGKNRPALDFLESVGTKFKEPIEGGYLFKFPVEFATALDYNPSAAEPEAMSESSDKAALATAGPVATTQTKSALISRIASELCTAEQILKTIESQKRRIRPKLKGTLVAPRNPIEKAIADLWTEILRLDRVSIDDNFFELGGHSLLATVLLSRVRDAFDVELSLHNFFNAPTVAGLAGLIEEAQIEQADKNEIAEMIQELDQLSDEEVRTLLSSEGQLARDGESENPAVGQD
jgi:FkbH-like protein